MSDLIKELSREVQNCITNLDNIAMLNISGKTFEELAEMRAEQAYAQARLRGSEKKLAAAIEFESNRATDG